MDTTQDFDGTTVLITGAAGNLGAAVARAFAARGARLALVAATAQVLRSGLRVLGVDAPESM